MIDRSITSERASLRRIDWRFLLPMPAGGVFEHLVLLGDRGELADRIAEVGLARRVSRELPPQPSADAVIVLGGASVSLKEVARCLAPGGVLYYEVDRRMASMCGSTPSRMQRELRQAGVHPIGIYWAKPNFDHCQMYLPLDLPVALQWYVRTLFTASTPLQRLLEPGLQALVGLRASLLAQLVPCYALVAIAAPGQAASLLDHPTLPDSLRDPKLRPIVLAGGDDLNRVVIFPFAPGCASPRTVLKLGRLASSRAQIEHEQAVLAMIYAALDRRLYGTIPQPLGIFRWGSTTAGIESCARGRSLATSTERWGGSLRQKISDMGLVAAWLGDFHEQTQIGCSSWEAEERANWVERPFAAYQQAFGLTPPEERLFAAAQACASSLAGAALPIVWAHWGFEQRNIFRADDTITVIDWEGAGAGPPLFDLLYFVTRWNESARDLRDQAAKLQGFYDLFLAPQPRDALSSAARQAIARYVAQLNIDQRFVALFLVVMWVERALGRFERQAALRQPAGDARHGNQYIQYIALLADNTAHLFAEKD